MNSFFTFIAIILAWVLSFIEPSGLAQALHITDFLNYLIAIVSLIFWLQCPLKRQKISDWLIAGIIITFILIPYFKADSSEGVTYLTSFLVVYIFSQAKVNYDIIKKSGIIIAALGIGVLLVYTRMEILSGWNDNAISMVGLFSFIYFSIFLILVKDKKKFILWNSITVIFLILLFETECRSGILFSIITVIAILWYKKTKKILLKKKSLFIMLNVPLIIAMIVIFFGQASIFNELNDLSMSQQRLVYNEETGQFIILSGKSLFNGRDELWKQSLEYLFQSDFIGTGKFLINYHNSCIAALSVFGILGYICWIYYFKNTIRQLQPFYSDKIILGCVIAFFMIYFQQSFDLGFISPEPNRIPYMILGLGLGRVYTIYNNRNPYLSSIS